MDRSDELQQQIGLWLGIVNQLYATRMRQLLSKHDLTTVQFALLNHLARQTDNPQSISQLTKALEVNQPGVTKIVQKLEGLGFLTIASDPVDSRLRLLSISRAGLKFIAVVMKDLGPDSQQMFLEWEQAELANLLGQLQKMGKWLDQHRLE